MALIAGMFAINLRPAGAPTNPVANTALEIPPAIQESYIANAKVLPQAGFELLKKLKQCNTDWADKTKTAKAEYRSLVFEAATAMGHPHPEKIMLINNKDEFAAAGVCQINKEEGRGINFDQAKFDKQPFGANRILLYHETAHLTHRDTTNLIKHLHDAIKKYKDATKITLDRYNQDPTDERLKKEYEQEKAKHETIYKKEIGQDLEDLRYKKEFEADRHAARAAACEVCAREMGDWFYGHKETKYSLGLDLKNIRKMDYQPLTKLIEKFEPVSRIYCIKENDCHPLCAERALRFYRYALSEGIKGKICPFHQKELAEKAKKQAAPAPNKPIAVDAQPAATKAPRIAVPVTPKPTPINIKADAELFTKPQLSAKTFRHKTLDTIIGKNIESPDDWFFDKTNMFVRGEIVSVLRSSGNLTYGVVLHQNAQGVAVQVDLESIQVNRKPELIGKNIG